MVHLNASKNIKIASGRRITPRFAQPRTTAPMNVFDIFLVHVYYETKGDVMTNKRPCVVQPAALRWGVGWGVQISHS